MKIQIPELRRRYTASIFGRHSFLLPKDIYSILEGSGVKGFQASLCQKGGYAYLQLFPDSEPCEYPIKGGRVSIPRDMKEALGIEREGTLVAYLGNIELWGPSLEGQLREASKESEQAAVFFEKGL
jgi:hypothetical protein